MFWPLSFGIEKCKNVVRKTNFHGLIFNISNATEFKITPYILLKWSHPHQLILSKVLVCSDDNQSLEKAMQPRLKYTLNTSHLLKSVSASKKDEYFIMTLPLVWACQLLFFPQLHNTLSGLKRTVQFALFRRSMLCTFCPFKKQGHMGW